jgi:hypothetical protein
MTHEPCLNRLFEIISFIRRLIPGVPELADKLYDRILACTDSGKVHSILAKAKPDKQTVAEIVALHGQWLSVAREAMPTLRSMDNLKDECGSNILRHLYPLIKSESARNPGLLVLCYRLDEHRLNKELASEIRRIKTLASGCISDRLLAARRIRTLGLGLSDTPETLDLLAPLVPVADCLLYDENTSVWRAGASAFGSLTARDDVWNLLKIHLRRDDYDKMKTGEKGNIHRQRHAFAALGTAIRNPKRREAVLEYAEALFQGEGESIKAYNKRITRARLDNIWILASFVYALPDMLQFAPEEAWTFFDRVAARPLSSDEHKNAIWGNLALAAREILEQTCETLPPREFSKWQEKILEWIKDEAVEAYFSGPLPPESFNRCEAMVRRHSVWQPLLRRCHDRPEPASAPVAELSEGLTAVVKAGETVRAAFIDSDPYSGFSTDDRLNRLADLRYAVQRMFSDGTLLASLTDDAGLRRSQHLAGRFDQVLAGCRELLLAVMDHASQKLPFQATDAQRALNHGIQSCCILMLGDLYDSMRNRNEYGNIFELVLPFVNPDKGQLVHKYVAATIVRCMELLWHQNRDSDARVSTIRAMIGQLRKAEWADTVQKEIKAFVKDESLLECVITHCGRPRLRELTSVAGIFEGNNIDEVIQSVWHQLTGKEPLSEEIINIRREYNTFPQAFMTDSRHLLRDRWLGDELNNNARYDIHKVLFTVTKVFFARILKPTTLSNSGEHLAKLFCAPVLELKAWEYCKDEVPYGEEGIFATFLNSPSAEKQGYDRLLSNGIKIPWHLDRLPPSKNWHGGSIYNDTSNPLSDVNTIKILFKGDESVQPSPWILVVGLIRALAQEKSFPHRKFHVSIEKTPESTNQKISIEPIGDQPWHVEDTNPLVSRSVKESTQPQKVGFWLHLIDQLLCPADKAWYMKKVDGKWRLYLEYKDVL